MVSVQFLRSRFSSIKKIKGDLILKFKENFHGNRFNKKIYYFQENTNKTTVFSEKKLLHFSCFTN